MKKKTYYIPKMEVVKLSDWDIIATSGTMTVDNPWAQAEELDWSSSN